MKINTVAFWGTVRPDVTCLFVPLFGGIVRIGIVARGGGKGWFARKCAYRDNRERSFRTEHEARVWLLDKWGIDAQEETAE